VLAGDVAPRRRQREEDLRSLALVQRSTSDVARFTKKQKNFDVRQQAIDAYVAGKKVSLIAQFCGVTERTIYNWLLVYRKYGVVKPKTAASTKFKCGHTQLADVDSDVIVVLITGSVRRTGIV
jgi:DNA-binding NarL/FixJ family response regulator